MKILIVSATMLEVAGMLDYFHQTFEPVHDFRFRNKGLDVSILITGVGMPQTVYGLTKILNKLTFDLIINLGICGSFDENIPIGTVVNVHSEQWGDLGTETATAGFSDIFEMGLSDPNLPPYQKGTLLNQHTALFDFLPLVHGLTVNKVHGFKTSIELVRQKYPNAQVESMEGAGFFYVCLLEGVNFLQIRAVSNYVEPRNTEAWNIPLALKNLESDIIRLLELLIE